MVRPGAGDGTTELHGSAPEQETTCLGTAGAGDDVLSWWWGWAEQEMK